MSVAKLWAQKVTDITKPHLPWRIDNKQAVYHYGCNISVFYFYYVNTLIQFIKRYLHIPNTIIYYLLSNTAYNTYNTTTLHKIATDDLSISATELL